MKKNQTLIIWISAFIFTVLLSYYQRTTGPTYPVSKKIMIGDTKIKYKLPTSADCGADQAVRITAPDTSVHGEFVFKRYKSSDEWSTVPMSRESDKLVSMIPQQPFAGKVIYRITLVKNGRNFPLHDGKDVIIRFKRSVPLAILIFHIFFIFGGMLLSTVSGLEASFRGKHLFTYIWLTVIFIFVGGLILGPVVQKYAFNAFWTGWPFGHDLTDNKTLAGLVFWIVALIVQYRKPGNRAWPVAAAIIFIVVFMIPHSVLGSEIDYTKQVKTEQHR